MSNPVTIDNVICGCSNQVMEQKRFGGYECPECGRTAEYVLTWEDGDE